MKTTVEIPDHLLSKLHAMAARERTTFKALLVAAVQQFLGSHAGRGGPRFRLEDRSVGGRGLRPELRGAGWDAIRDLSYEGRGGRAGSP